MLRFTWQMLTRDFAGCQRLLLETGTAQPDAARRSQSRWVGVRCSGSDASAPRISSRVNPTCCAARMNDTRRMVAVA